MTTRAGARTFPRPRRPLDRRVPRRRQGRLDQPRRSGDAAVAQTIIFVARASVALLADLIHNFGDALTAIPLGDRLLPSQRRGERWAGSLSSLAIFVSALRRALRDDRALHPPAAPDPPLGARGRRRHRLRRQRDRRPRPATRRQAARQSCADRRRQPRPNRRLRLTRRRRQRDRRRARAPIADPIIGLVITLVILKITWDSWQTIYGHAH